MKNTTTDQFVLAHGGDILTVQYDGNMWLAPNTGSQHATRSDAIRQELGDYLTACGEAPRDADGDIEYSGLVLAEHGEWMDEDD